MKYTESRGEWDTNELLKGEREKKEGTMAGKNVTQSGFLQILEHST